jgi:hypothetical protein
MGQSTSNPAAANEGVNTPRPGRTRRPMLIRPWTYSSSTIDPTARGAGVRLTVVSQPINPSLLAQMNRHLIRGMKGPRILPTPEVSSALVHIDH